MGKRTDGPCSALLGVSLVVLIATSLLQPRQAHSKDLRRHDAFVLLAKQQLAEVSFEQHFPGRITDQSAEIAMTQVAARVNYAVARWGSGLFSVGAQYQLNVFSLSNTTDQVVEEGSHLLHQVGLWLGCLQVLDDAWYLTVGLHPYMSSDFKEFDSDVLFMEGRVEAGWAYSKQLAFRFGVGVTARFGIYLPIPVFGFSYRPRWRWFELDAQLPKYLRARFRVTDYLTLDAFGELSPHIWDINQQNLGTRFKYMTVKTGVGVSLRLWRFALRVSSGVAPIRIMSSYGVEGTSAQEYDLRTSVVPFIDTTIRFGPGG